MHCKQQLICINQVTRLLKTACSFSAQLSSNRAERKTARLCGRTGGLGQLTSSVKERSARKQGGKKKKGGKGRGGSMIHSNSPILSLDSGQYHAKEKPPLWRWSEGPPMCRNGVQYRRKLALPFPIIHAADAVSALRRGARLFLPRTKEMVGKSAILTGEGENKRACAPLGMSFGRSAAGGLAPSNSWTRSLPSSQLSRGWRPNLAG